MVLGVDKLLELVKEKKLVEGLCERELTNPEGAGFDLRVGEIFDLEGEGFLGIENRDTPNLNKVVEYKGDNPPASAETSSGKEELFELLPGKYYLVTTIESVNLPENLIAFIVSRTTLFRSGIALFNGAVSPGYQGKLTFAICNLGGKKIKLALGARVVHITFHEVAGSSNAYRGQWQGGRVTTTGTEKQV
jgi:deoxycytidine triphosphate deaminase